MIRGMRAAVAEIDGDPVERLLERAATARVLALGFAYPSDGHRGAFVRELGKLRRGARRDALVSLERLRNAWIAADEAALRAEYTRLFLVDPQAPPHETAYGDARRVAGRAAELADIGGFYAAFGLQAGEAAPDLPDHIAAELEFHSLLLVKQAYASARARGGERLIAARAARTFLAEHLGRWSGAFADTVAGAQAAEPYRVLAESMHRFVASECRRLRARLTPIRRRPPLDPMQGSELVCPRVSEPAAFLAPPPGASGACS